MDEIRDLQAQVERLTAELESVKSRLGPPAAPAATPSDDTPAADASDVSFNRRRLLKVAGTGAAVAAAGVVAATATATPAFAANGDPLYLGVANAASFETFVQDTGSGYKATDFFQFTDGSSNAPTTSPAVLAGLSTNSTTKVGVIGSTTNTDYYGVIGKLEGLSQGSGAGVTGQAVGTGNGVYGNGINGVVGVGNNTGIVGQGATGVDGSGTIGLAGSGTDANLLLVPGGVPAPARPNGTPGQFVVDSNDDLWFCTAVNTWRKLCGPGSAGGFFVLDASMRIYDSRAGYLPSGPGITKGQFAPGGSRTIDCTLNGAVPAGATAALVNVTITNTTSDGWLAVYKNGIAFPDTSSINWSGPDTNLANLCVVALDAGAQFAAMASAPTDLVVDVIGYYH